MSAPILQGLRVVELTRGWSASALCGTMLAELGADVVSIAVEGQPLDAVLAASKQSEPLDTSAGDRNRRIEALIEAADVLVDDRHYSRMLGIADALDRATSRNPRLVHCVITPFGRTGPLSDMAGSDLIVQAMSGAMSTTGFPYDPPTRVGVPVGDHSASLFAGCAIVAALYRRLESGKGETIDISIHDCLLTYLATFLPAYCESGRSPERIGNMHPMVAPWNSYRASDGWVIVCVGSDKQWIALTRQIGSDAVAMGDDYPTRELRLLHRDEIDATVTAWTRDRTVAEIVATLDALDIPAGPIQTIADLVADPQVQARKLLVRDSRGAVQRLGSMFKMSETPGSVAVPSREPRAREISADDDAPLAGVRVLECGAYTAGPLCARILADLGAEVVKIEPHEGDPVRALGGTIDGMSHIFRILNHGKKSITVDARSEEGRATLLSLCAQSDVLLENLAPGVLAKWGLDLATLQARNPRLVYCSINGYGWNGPMGGKRAFDTVVQARAAILSQTGYADGPPTKMGASLADVACAVFGAFSIAAALYAQRTTGIGRFLDVSMFDVLARMSARQCIEHIASGTVADRSGNGSARHSPHNLYRARNAYVVIAALDDSHWRNLRRLFENDGCALPAGLETPLDRLQCGEALDAAIGAWAARSDADSLVSQCQEAGVPAARVLAVGDVVAHPHVRERAMIPTVRVANRDLPLLGSPIRFASDRMPRRIRPAPALGAHNQEIISALRVLETHG